MKLRAKYIINQICYSLIMSAGLFMFAKESIAAVAPNDTNYANTTCSTAGLSDKQYDENDLFHETQQLYLRSNSSEPIVNNWIKFIRDQMHVTSKGISRKSPNRPMTSITQPSFCSFRYNLCTPKQPKKRQSMSAMLFSFRSRGGA